MAAELTAGSDRIHDKKSAIVEFALDQHLTLMEHSQARKLMQRSSS